MSENQKVGDDTAKIYAPLLVKLESEYPDVARYLTGIGASPVAYDASRTEVKAYFQTEAGSRFHGAYHTTEASSVTDAATFVGKIVQKFRAVTAEDAKVLASQPAPVAPLPVPEVQEVPPSEPPSGPPLTPDDDEDPEDSELPLNDDGTDGTEPDGFPETEPSR